MNKNLYKRKKEKTMKTAIMKPLAIVVCAILLVAATVAGTVAFLTDQASVNNTFTVGSVEITLDEAKVTAYGVKDGESRVDKNVYKLIPGHSYLKDPTIHVKAGSENCYLFFEIENGLNGDATFDIKAADWTQIGTSGVYYYKAVAIAENDYVAFTAFELSNDINVADYKDAAIDVTAYAVQADGFANAEAAWTATFGAPPTP